MFFAVYVAVYKQWDGRSHASRCYWPPLQDCCVLCTGRSANSRAEDSDAGMSLEKDRFRLYNIKQQSLMTRNGTIIRLKYCVFKVAFNLMWTFSNYIYYTGLGFSLTCSNFHLHYPKNCCPESPSLSRIVFEIRGENLGEGRKHRLCSLKIIMEKQFICQKFVGITIFDYKPTSFVKSTVLWLGSYHFIIWPFVLMQYISDVDEVVLMFTLCGLPAGDDWNI